MKMILWYLVLSLFLFLPQSVAEEKEVEEDALNRQMEQMQTLIERQSKVLESMSNSLPSVTDSIMEMGEKLQMMKEEEHALVKEQVSELEGKVERVLRLIEEEKNLEAKIKAMGIKAYCQYHAIETGWKCRSRRRQTW